MKQEFEKLTSLDTLVRRSGVGDEIVLRAFKRGYVLEVERLMNEQQVSKTSLAKRVGTSRAQLDRVLDPDSHNVTLETLARVAQTLGKKLQLELV